MSIEDQNTPSDGLSVSPQLKTQAAQDLGQVTDKARHDLEEVAHRAQNDARELGQQASEKLAEVTDKAKSFAGDQKDMAAGQINGVAYAITKVAEELDNSDQQTVARYARDLASGISSVGKTIEDRDVDELMGLAQDFGRNQPVAFLGAAALAGFVASRFAFASAHRRDTKAAPASSFQAEGSASAYAAQSMPNGKAGA